MAPPLNRDRRGLTVFSVDQEDAPKAPAVKRRRVADDASKAGKPASKWTVRYSTTGPAKGAVACTSAPAPAP
jgi:hypothetical protein